jgi:hypothetical protein
MRLHLSIAAALLSQAVAQAPASEFVVSRVDGTQLTGRVVKITGDQLQLTVGGETKSTPLREVLAVHGGVPRGTPFATARLVGGDEVRGEPRPGDPGGETFVLESRSLGPVAIPVDRLAALVVHSVAGATDPSEFALPADSTHEEAVFLPARRGFDSVFGSIHRFAADGVYFAANGVAEPRLYPYARLAAVALRSGAAPASKPSAVLVTRAGDCLCVAVVDADATDLRLDDERGRRLVLPWAEVATLLWRGADRVFLSELQPDAVVEAGALTSGNEPLYTWRRDRNVRGGFLSVAGRCYARGLGVHSRAALTYVVPPGFDTLCLGVGIDDEVLALPARGDVDIAIAVAGETVVQRQGVRSGEPMTNLGCVAVRPGAKVTLTVEYGAGLDLGDRVDWLHAVLLRRGP